MRLNVMLAVLLLLLLAPPATAGFPPGSEFYTAKTTGELTIDTQGRVSDVDLDHRRLGKSTIDAIAALIRRWEFDPVVEGGRAVEVRGRMSLSLVAVRVPGRDGWELGIRDVVFLDPPGTRARPGRPVPVGPLAPPRFPEASLQAGVGGLVMLELRIAADGRVADVAARRVLLFGDVNPDAQVQNVHISRFVEAATAAAAAWRFRVEGEQQVRVPVKFALHDSEERWSRTRVYALAPPPWLAAVAAGASATELDPSGQGVDERLRLRTAVEDPLMPADKA